MGFVWESGLGMQPWKENGSAISSEEVNFLVFRYLQESGEGDPAATSCICVTYMLR